MTKYEYKTVKLDVTINGKGMFGTPDRDVPDLNSTLNTEGKEGWRLCESILPTFNGRSDQVILIFEREFME